MSPKNFRDSACVAFLLFMACLWSVDAKFESVVVSKVVNYTIVTNINALQAASRRLNHEKFSFNESTWKWEPFPTTYDDSQPKLSEAELYQRLVNEKGFFHLRELFETFHFPDAESSRNCRRLKDDPNSSEFAGKPLCLQPKHLKLPDKWVTFEDFLKGQTPYPFPYNGPIYYGGFPFLDSYGFKYLGDKYWETISYLRNPKVQDIFDPRTITNRSLIFWSLGQFQGRHSDLRHLHRILNEGSITKPFFLLHHVESNPGFPPWLLDHPLILKIFALNVPEYLRHPKVVPLPLGLRPHRFKAAQKMWKAIKNYTAKAAPPDSLLFIKGFSLGTQGNRKKNRMRILGPLTKSFDFTIESATNASFTSEQYYKLMLRHKFVLSLRGFGSDAFRTWEALYLGRPVLVGRVLPDWVYDGFPVVMGLVQNMKPKLLERTWEAFRHRKFNIGRLWMPWWMTFIVRECLAVR